MLGIHKLYYYLGFPPQWVLDAVFSPLLKLAAKIDQMAGLQGNKDKWTQIQGTIVHTLFIIALDTVNSVILPTTFGAQMLARHSELVRALLAAKVPEVRSGSRFLGIGIRGLGSRKPKKRFSYICQFYMFMPCICLCFEVPLNSRKGLPQHENPQARNPNLQSKVWHVGLLQAEQSKPQKETLAALNPKILTP